MIINGVDYSAIIVVAVTVIALAAAEYFICLKSKKSSYRKVLLFVPFMVLVGAMFVYGGEGGGFIDLRGYVAVILAVYALICAAAIGAGWFAFKLKYESKPDISENCPLSDKTDN